MATCVVTGGSRGIGAAIVAAFSRRGDRVFFLYEKEHEAAKSVAANTGATAICCDVADGSAVERVFSEIGNVDSVMDGNLDLFINEYLKMNKSKNS